MSTEQLTKNRTKNMIKIPAGTKLEARIQRLSLAQGIFAERTLFPSASEDHRLLATDIDVLCSEYHPDLRLTRSNYECKSGKVSVLDRIFWLGGLRQLLNSDASYLVVKKVEEDVFRFGKALNVELLSIDKLDSLESDLGIATKSWPGRSNYSTFENALAAWRQHYNQEDTEKTWQELKQCMSFINVDSWLTFSYRNLNRLLRLLSETATILRGTDDADVTLCSRYLVGALAVRFSQCLLHICHDTTVYGVHELEEFLKTKLVFGDNNPKHSRKLIDGVLALVSHKMNHSNFGTLNISTSRFTAPPEFATDFAKLVSEVGRAANSARFGPIAMEMKIFDTPKTISQFPALSAACDSASMITGLITGFLIRSIGVPATSFDTILPELEQTYS